MGMWFLYWFCHKLWGTFPMEAESDSLFQRKKESFRSSSYSISLRPLIFLPSSLTSSFFLCYFLLFHIFPSCFLFWRKRISVSCRHMHPFALTSSSRSKKKTEIWSREREKETKWMKSNGKQTKRWSGSVIYEYWNDAFCDTLLPFLPLCLSVCLSFSNVLKYRTDLCISWNSEIIQHL